VPRRTCATMHMPAVQRPSDCSRWRTSSLSRIPLPSCKQTCSQHAILFYRVQQQLAQGLLDNAQEACDTRDSALKAPHAMPASLR
jgi:hypothetical protein